MVEFRVTKHDPAHRDRHGAYRREEWTSSSDIGRESAGAVLAESEYQRVEDAYVAVEFLREAGVPARSVAGLEIAEASAHVGYDYSMCIGVPTASPGAVTLALQVGLFPEPFGSPYREQRHAEPGAARPARQVAFLCPKSTEAPPAGEPWRWR